MKRNIDSISDSNNTNTNTTKCIIDKSNTKIDEQNINQADKTKSEFYKLLNIKLPYDIYNVFVVAQLQLLLCHTHLCDCLLMS